MRPSLATRRLGDAGRRTPPIKLYARTYVETEMLYIVRSYIVRRSISATPDAADLVRIRVRNGEESSETAVVTLDSLFVRVILNLKYKTAHSRTAHLAAAFALFPVSGSGFHVGFSRDKNSPSGRLVVETECLADFPVPLPRVPCGPV